MGEAHRVNCLLLALLQQRVAGHPRLPPELLEWLHDEFCVPAPGLDVGLLVAVRMWGVFSYIDGIGGSAFM